MMSATRPSGSRCCSRILLFMLSAVVQVGVLAGNQLVITQAARAGARFNFPSTPFGARAGVPGRVDVIGPRLDVGSASESVWGLGRRQAIRRHHDRG
jgi:hypothetical protein